MNHENSQEEPKATQSKRIMHPNRFPALLAMVLFGCSTIPVGNTLIEPGKSRLLCFAPPGMTLKIEITSSGDMFGWGPGLSPSPGYDNHSSRPIGIPLDHVAYVSPETVFQTNHTYTAELQYLSSVTGNYERLDDVAGWNGGNDLILIY